MDYKKQTREYYDKYGENFGEDKIINYQSFVKDFLSGDLDLFLRELKGERVLDLGSGPGRDSLFFKKQGLKPVCVDISPAMIRACRDKGLDAVVMDMEDLGFVSESFDGVWANASLLHVPKKIIGEALGEVCRVLKQGGVSFVGMKEGDYEGYIPNQFVPVHTKFIAMYSDGEFREFLDERFEILKFSRVEVDEFNTYLNYLCRKK